MLHFEELATNLMYPEGPVALSDGSVVVSEVGGGAITRVDRGVATQVAKIVGSPAGCAVGPDGALYVCNSGGTTFRQRAGLTEPYGTPSSYTGGEIDRVDLKTGNVTVLYRECDGTRLSSPNDIVFDSSGGFYFTDLGKTHSTYRHRGAVFYAQPDGSAIDLAIFPLETPNGIGLSPDGEWLYVAETIPGRLWSFKVMEPGKVRTEDDRYARGTLVAGLPGLQCFDSLAVQQDGSICVATLVSGGITRFSPSGESVEFFELPDSFTTNLCFGAGPDASNAYITLSSTGRLVKCNWDSPGLSLNYTVFEKTDAGTQVSAKGRRDVQR